MRHANNLESVLTYEGTVEMHALVIGRHHRRVRLPLTRPSPLVLSAYVPLFRVPGAARFIAGTGLARTGGAMFGAVIVMVSERQGSAASPGPSRPSGSPCSPWRARSSAGSSTSTASGRSPCPSCSSRRPAASSSSCCRGVAPVVVALPVLRPERRPPRARPDVASPVGAHLPRRAGPPAHRDVVRAGLRRGVLRPRPGARGARRDPVVPGGRAARRRAPLRRRDAGLPGGPRDGAARGPARRASRWLGLAPRGCSSWPRRSS